ncbi:unnamed protein product [Trichobilharzia regenti]|uniref:Uncharacterized protein n=1 Tax=Trichobilharzia regenti TaxID=157069 RepID=A0A183VLR4_TRIRE|nr:unnamed protein product [Trichobilharzia regenti]VDP97299.1 unnamed protein product [Trichobilharzia regenti]
MDWNKKRLNLNEPTEFESLITIEPMEVSQVKQEPLDLSFEEYETSRKPSSIHISPNEPRGVLKKKPRFADPIIIEEENVVTSNNIDCLLNEDQLIEQMDSISVEDPSDKPGGSENEIV